MSFISLHIPRGKVQQVDPIEIRRSRQGFPPSDYILMDIFTYGHILRHAVARWYSACSSCCQGVNPHLHSPNSCLGPEISWSTNECTPSSECARPSVVSSGRATLSSSPETTKSMLGAFDSGSLVVASRRKICFRTTHVLVKCSALVVR